MKIILAALSIIFFFSCSHKITTDLSDSMEFVAAPQDIILLPLKSKPPEGKLLGTVRLGDSGFSTNCTYNDAIEKARITASKNGGNLLRLIEHKKPNFGSSCDRVTAEIYRVAESYLTKKDQNTLGDVEYALLHIYRPKEFRGSAIKYNVHFGDSLIARVSNNFRTTVRLDKEGPNIIWSRTESRMEIPVEVEFGKEYYLRCTVDYGAMVGRPDFQLVNKEIGEPEFKSIAGRR